MAKFLPFVVEKSTPLYIYQTLISRSKGMNNLLIASIFYLVVDKGITNVRKVADGLPEMPITGLYKELLNQYPNNTISNEFYQKMQSISSLVKEHSWHKIPEELKEYTLTDTMTFLLVMTLLEKTEEYTDLPLGDLYTDKAKASENELQLTDLFSNSGPVKNFTSKEALAAYIHFFSLIEYGDTPPVKAVLFPVASAPSGRSAPEPQAQEVPDPRGRPEAPKEPDLPKWER